jgi:hypothetical protein
MRQIVGLPAHRQCWFAAFEYKLTTPHARAFSERRIFTMGARVSAFLKFIK